MGVNDDPNSADHNLDRPRADSPRRNGVRPLLCSSPCMVERRVLTSAAERSGRHAPKWRTAQPDASEGADAATQL